MSRGSVFIYAGAPMPPKRSGRVVFFDSPQARANALLPYRIFAGALSDKDVFNKSQTRFYVEANASAGIERATYLQIVNFFSKEVLFYYITDVNALPPDEVPEGSGAAEKITYELTIDEDEWQTEYFATNAEFAPFPVHRLRGILRQSTNAAAGIKGEITAEVETAINKPRTAQKITLLPSGATAGRWCIVTQYAAANGRLYSVVDVPQAATTDALQLDALVYSGATALRTVNASAGASFETNVQAQKQIVVPSWIVDLKIPDETQPLSFLQVKTTAGSWYGQLFFAGAVEKVFDFGGAGEILPNGVLIASVGTAFTRAELTFVYSCYSRSEAEHGNDFSREAAKVKFFSDFTNGLLYVGFEQSQETARFADLQKVDITEDFAVPLSYSQGAQLDAQNRASDAINIVSSMLSVGVGLGTGNAVAVAGGLLSTARTAAGIFERGNTPASVRRSTGNGWTNLQSGGVFVQYAQSVDARRIAARYGLALVAPSFGVFGLSAGEYERADAVEVQTLAADHARFIAEELAAGVRFDLWQI